MKTLIPHILSKLRSIGRGLLPLTKKRELFEKKAVGTGSGGDLTYRIDREAEDIIIEGLRTIGEPITVISEETGVMDIEGGSNIFALIDPIDGSKNAVAGIPFFCSSIAILSGDTLGDIELGYIINMISGDEFWAEKDRGSFLNGERIYSQESDDPYFLAFETQNAAKDIEKILPLFPTFRKARCFGSIALDLAYLAKGSFSVVVNPSLSRSFDFGAGYLILREAGGVFTDIEGKPINGLKIGLKRSTSFVASGNSRIHEKAIGLLRLTRGA